MIVLDRVMVVMVSVMVILVILIMFLGILHRSNQDLWLKLDPSLLH